MDKSVDSIGSCSLDVDADSSEKSDTSGSLNFPTPISIKDTTRDFVANINERCCPVRKIDTTATLMNSSSSSSQVQTISTQPTCTAAPCTSALQSIATEVGNDKKPSYLNLACCVNGYSNITTYDSKIRQDINNSREVSPIRPSTSSIQYCKKNDFLAPPKLQKMPNTSPPETDIKQREHKPAQSYENGNGHHHVIGPDEAVEVKNTSFIQQQMERLYGPAALAQGFYSPKKVRNATAPQRVDNGGGGGVGPTSELKLKFKELSPSKDYSEFRRKINGTGAQTTVRQTVIETNPDNNNIDLPVLRHLSHEFRAQLPKISPKRNVLRSPPPEDENDASLNSSNATGKYVHKIDNQLLDEVDHKSIANEAGLDTKLIESVRALDVTEKTTEPIMTEVLKPAAENNDVNIVESNHHVKDGHYFIKILKAEGTRLLALAAVAENYIEELSNQPEVGEEVLGLLRSASGKARLLVSQKMKQFEGLCHKNLNYTPGEACRTTADDLQGFWDMVYLQVDDINAIFAEVENLKQNNWKLDKTTQPQMSPKKQTKSSNAAAANGSSKTPKPKSAAALERESQRKQKILEMKRQKKLELAAAAANAGSDEKPTNVVAAAAAENPIEIFVNQNKS